MGVVRRHFTLDRILEYNAYTHVGLNKRTMRKQTATMYAVLVPQKMLFGDSSLATYYVVVVSSQSTL
jgi:hypothetical protein